MVVAPAFVFLPESGEDPNERVARCAEEVLAVGAMGNKIRHAWWSSFLEGAFGVGEEISGVATSCAMFAGGCCIHADVQNKRPPPKARAIHTWMGVHGFTNDKSWIPASDAIPQRGDVTYVASMTGSTGKKGTPSYYEWHRWELARDGHVEILIDGEGYEWKRAAGGQGSDGTVCLMTKKSDIRKFRRPFRGLYRPRLMLLQRHG